MSKIWHYISYLGLKDDKRYLSDRNIILANRINFLMISFLFLLSLVAAINREISGHTATIHTLRLLILLVACLPNFIFSYFNKHDFTKINLIFSPVLIIVFLPIFTGNISESDFIDTPLIILCLSFIPQLILQPKLNGKLYLASLFYFLLQVIFLDDFLVYFSKQTFNIVASTDGFHFFYKMVFIAIFVFLQTTMYYLRNINYVYEKELLKTNEALNSYIEELKTTQQYLVQSEKMAALGILTAGVAHEINNPLNFIQGGIVGIKSYFNDNIPEHLAQVEPLIDAMQTGVNRAAEIVTSLNHYSRRDDLPRTVCNIDNILDNCLLMLHNQLKSKVEVEKNYTNLPYVLICNDGKLHQAFLNIIANAGQAISKKGNISIVTQIVNEYLQITISDNGDGISDEDIKKIFDPFFTTKDPGKGTGLGLSITYKIIQEHKGTIEYESEVGVGTNVIVKLPINTEQ